MAERKLIAALKIARKSIHSTRRTIFESNCFYDKEQVKRVVTDPGALDWISELDSVLAKIDAALTAPIEAEAQKAATMDFALLVSSARNIVKAYNEALSRRDISASVDELVGALGAMPTSSASTEVVGPRESDQ
jgi:hypothetical protein